MDMLGHNNPPEPSPFEAVRTHIDDLLTEARNWLDGQGVETQTEADAVSVLLDELRKGYKAADAARKEEAKPFDDGKAEVQARYNPILKAAETGADACKKALAPYLQKLEDEKRAQAEAKRREAEEAAAKAAEAARLADAANLEQRELAEALVAKAAEAERAAKAAEQSKAHAKGGERAAGLRSYFKPVLTDGQAALTHYWRTNRAALEAFALDLAAKDVQAGKRQIPGFDVIEERRVV